MTEAVVVLQPKPSFFDILKPPIGLASFWINLKSEISNFRFEIVQKNQKNRTEKNRNRKAAVEKTPEKQRTERLEAACKPANHLGPAAVQAETALAADPFADGVLGSGAFAERRSRSSSDCFRSRPQR